MNTRPFYKGVDISSLLESEDSGMKLYNAKGDEVDGLKLCKENGVNSIRLRIWNNPENIPEAKGYCDLEHTVAFGKRIKAEGFHFLLDFHYSDYWADPGKQRKPKAWESLSFDELKEAVYSYTKEVLERLQQEGCLPDMVQIGNEIRSGMLFPDGEVPNYKQLSELINAGIKATREVCSDIEIMIHLDQGGRFFYLKEWFDNVIENGTTDFDVIGVSYYPFWHGTFSDLKDSLEALVERYGRPVIVAETAHPWRRCEEGFVTEDQEKIAGFKAGVDEQDEVMELVMQIVGSVTEDMGCGVYYWEPLVMPMECQGTWGNNMGVLDLEGRAHKGFARFKYTRANSQGVDIEARLDEVRQRTRIAMTLGAPPEGENLVKNSDFSEEEKNWMVVKSEEYVFSKIIPADDVSQEKCMYIESPKNFTFQLLQDVIVPKPGKYTLRCKYTGTNTTDVNVYLKAQQIGIDGANVYSKTIYPTDDGWMEYEIDNMELSEGSIQVCLEIKAPPVWGKIKDISLYLV